MAGSKWYHYYVIFGLIIYGRALCRDDREPSLLYVLQ